MAATPRNHDCNTAKSCLQYHLLRLRLQVVTRTAAGRRKHPPAVAAGRSWWWRGPTKMASSVASAGAAAASMAYLGVEQSEKKPSSSRSLTAPCLPSRTNCVGRGGAQGAGWRRRRWLGRGRPWAGAARLEWLGLERADWEARGSATARRSSASGRSVSGSMARSAKRL